MNEFLGTVQEVFGIGIDPQEMSVLHVTARAVLVFLITLAYVRFGDKRFLSRKTAFDAVLGLILASMMARAINGSAALLPTIAGGLVLVVLHRIFARLATRWHAFGVIVKGQDRVVVRDGVIDREALHRSAFSERDLMEDVRLHGGVAALDLIEEARIERNGKVSVVRKR